MCTNICTHIILWFQFVQWSLPLRYQVALRRGKRFCDIWWHKVQQLHWSLLVFAFCSDGKSHGYSASFTNSWKPVHIRRHPYEQNVIKGTENVEASFHTCTSCSIQHTLTQMKSFASCDSSHWLHGATGIGSKCPCRSAILPWPGASSAASPKKMAKWIKR